MQYLIGIGWTSIDFTWLSDVVDWSSLFLWHEPDDGEDDEPGENACSTIDARYDKRVPDNSWQLHQRQSSFRRMSYKCGMYDIHCEP